MAVEEKRAAEIHVLDVRFKYDADMTALFEAIKPPDDTKDQLPPILVEAEDDLYRRLVCWGYASDPYGDYRRLGRLTTLGIYGDWTLHEDNERFFPLIAPFVQDGSRVVFELEYLPRSGSNPHFYERDFEAWEFDKGAVTRRTVERTIEFD